MWTCVVVYFFSVEVSISSLSFATASLGTWGDRWWPLDWSSLLFFLGWKYHQPGRGFRDQGGKSSIQTYPCQKLILFFKINLCFGQWISLWRSICWSIEDHCWSLKIIGDHRRPLKTTDNNKRPPSSKTSKDYQKPLKTTSKINKNHQNHQKPPITIGNQPKSPKAIKNHHNLQKP